ncbi:hypothetical protein MMC27_000182 [Xylographa pallens]|nr:hypothetical protein [Xylographa pallens]
MAPLRVASIFIRSAKELGLFTLYRSPRDVKFLCLQRSIRLVANGACSLILALHLARLGFSDTKIGLFMSLTLLGNVFIAFLLTLMADAWGRRNILAVGAILMIASGIVFGGATNYWVLLGAAVFGVISPSGNEIGPFRAIEESILAQLAPFTTRGDIYAWYNLIGTLGQALGNICCGWLLQSLQKKAGWDTIQSYRIVFFAYAGLGLLKLLLTFALSGNCELKKEEDRVHGSEQPTEVSRLLQDNRREGAAEATHWAVPAMSKHSRIVLLKLCFLFSIDSFASGLVPQSWISYFFNSKFDLELGTLGSLFFVTSVISAFSNLAASALSKHIGLIKAMVFTNLPAAIMLGLIPIPNSSILAMVFLILRSCTNSMDNAPRSAFLAAVVLPSERTLTMGIVNVVKTSSQSVGPVITGFLAEAHNFWIAFLVAGGLKILYDLGILAAFMHHKTREEEIEQGDGAENEHIQEEEEVNID